MDPHSYSKPHEARVEHLHLTLLVSFDQKVIEGTARWNIWCGESTKQLILDTKDLTIKGVKVDGTPANYSWTEPDAILGAGLVIPVTPEVASVEIAYATSQSAEALMWLNPEQTSGTFPFLFTQSQAILARSWVPCQDSPGVRFTYDASVNVPSGMIALMSATNPTQSDKSGHYEFHMRQPIPSYLLALCVGDIKFNKVSDRCGIYAEESVLKAAAYEFADLERMVASAEEIYGAYGWERYDLIVLPPSFPFGGMENPRLTFVTPTILAGDRSLTSLIAHELAHSWSGNLVTNATWNDFWLNEGFTVYFETRIVERLYGKEESEMHALLNLHDLTDEVNSLKKKGMSEDTKLRLNLSGRSPDEGVTDIAYNKGYFFLRTIEERFGRARFDSFVKNYFDRFAFQSMDTDRFRMYIKTYYQSNYSLKIEDSFLDSWIESEGIPENCPVPETRRLSDVEGLVGNWQSDGVLPDTPDWGTQEWLHFLNAVGGSLTVEQLAELDAFGNFSNCNNAEILTKWCVLAINAKYDPALPQLKKFLLVTGRRKFLMPLYEALMKTDWGLAFAQEVYREARGGYHFVATNSLDPLVLTAGTLDAGK